MALEGTKVLTLHSVRRDTDRPGIYACIAETAGGKFVILERHLIWEPETPILKDSKMAAIFSFLKFGQPSAIKLQSGDFLMTHWYCKDGIYKTCATRFQL